MTPHRFNEIRTHLGLTWDQYGRALGYGGENPRQAIHALYRGERAIPPYIARLAIMFDLYGVPPELEKGE